MLSDEDCKRLKDLAGEALKHMSTKVNRATYFADILTILTIQHYLLFAAGQKKVDLAWTAQLLDRQKQTILTMLSENNHDLSTTH